MTRARTPGSLSTSTAMVWRSMGGGGVTIVPLPSGRGGARRAATGRSGGVAPRPPLSTASPLEGPPHLTSPRGERDDRIGGAPPTLPSPARGEGKVSGGEARSGSERAPPSHQHHPFFGDRA